MPGLSVGVGAGGEAAHQRGRALREGRLLPAAGGSRGGGGAVPQVPPALVRRMRRRSGVGPARDGLVVSSSSSSF